MSQSNEERIQVIVRCRPMNEMEERKRCRHVLSMSGETCVISKHDPQRPDQKTFTYDRSYPDHTTTDHIYQDIVSPVIQSVTEGYNGTIFAYGQTSCGKTFTMQGVTDPPTQQGIIPRSVRDIFSTVESCSDQFLVYASCFEIYNEEIRDLLGKNITDKLDIGSSPNKGFYVKGLSKHTVTGVQQCECLINRGLGKRAIGSTQMNTESSRSHTVFTLCVEAQGEGGHIRAGKLNLVDLAGSERQAKTGATGDRFRESVKINLSLHTLGRVISTLAEGECQFIPYRESKLTKLLQDSLGGTARTLMVACVSPADFNYEETLSTLRFASRAKKIVNKPVINEDPKDALLKEYQEEIRQLKVRLQEAGNMTNKIPDDDLQDLLTEVERKKEETFNAEKAAMQMEYERKLKEKEEETKEQKTLLEETRRDLEQMKLAKNMIESQHMQTMRAEASASVKADSDAEQLRQEDERKIRMLKEEQEKRIREMQERNEEQLQKEKELKARLEAEMDANRQKYEQELQAMREEAEELRRQREHDLEVTRVESERRVEEARRLKEETEAESKKCREEDEKLAGAVQEIYQQDHEAHLRNKAMNREAEMQGMSEEQLQREKDLKASFQTEMDANQQRYEQELQAMREKADELRRQREHDLEMARVESEQRVKEEKRLKEKAEAESEKRREEDEILARAVQEIYQQDHEAHLRKREKKREVEMRERREKQLQREKDLKANFQTEMDENQQELQAMREREEELRKQREHDLEVARVESEQRMEEARRLKEEAEAENEKRRDEDEKLARAVHEIHQKDHEAYLRKREAQMSARSKTPAKKSIVTKFMGVSGLFREDSDRENG